MDYKDLEKTTLPLSQETISTRDSKLWPGTDGTYFDDPCKVSFFYISCLTFNKSKVCVQKQDFQFLLKNSDI